MGKLQKLREIIDQHLRHVNMTEGQKAEVRRRIENGETGKKPVSRRVWYSVGAAAAALALLAIIISPAVSGGLFARKASDGNTAAATADAGMRDVVAEESVEEAESAPSSSVTTGGTGGASYSSLAAAAESAPTFEAADGLSYRVFAEKTSAGVMAADSAFLIEVTGGETSAEALEKRVTIEPAVSFTLAAEAENRYMLTPEAPFGKGEIVMVSIGDGEGQQRSWAFQTEASLRVLSTLPGNGTDGMPLETGIEFYFSRRVSAGAEKYFEITPAVKGSFLYYGKTVAFVPDDDLAPLTVYTVTMHEGLAADSGEVLEEPYSFSFRTPSDSEYDRFYFNLSGELTESFIPGDPIAIGVYASEGESDVSVKLFSVPDAETYLSLAQDYYEGTYPWLYGRGDVAIPTQGLAQYGSFDAQIVRPENYWRGESYITLPDLPEGWYLAEISRLDKHVLYKLIQVSPLSVYFEARGGEALVWLNDAESGNPVAGADVRLTPEGRTVTGRTDGSGIAALSGPAPKDFCYAPLLITSGGRTFADYLFLDAGVERDPSYDYYSFLYLDRSLYQPTDTVQFWGTLLPKHGASLPRTLRILTGMIGEPREAGTVDVAADGSFTGTFSLKNNISGYVTLFFATDEGTVLTSSFYVLEYTKPAYVLTAEFDRPYYRAHDNLGVDLHAEFFDGTPATGLEITLYKDGNSEEIELDESGAAFRYVSANTYGTSWEPVGQYVDVSTSGAEDVNVYAFAHSWYFRTDYMLTAEAGDDGTAEIRTNAIDYSAFEQFEDSYYGHLDELRGAAADMGGTISLVRCYYEKYESGSYYDAINKVTVPTYDYDYREDTVELYPFMTENGYYRTRPIENPDYSDNAYYRLEISYTTPDHVSCQESIYLSSSRYPGMYYSGYYMTREDSDDHDMKLGETGEFSISYDEPVKGGKTLYTVISEDLTRREIVPGGRFSLTYTKELLPNALLYGAYFDGRHVYSVGSIYLYYDYEEQELELTVTPEQETYAPGDEVRATLRVTDREGKPVSAGYAIGVVDEALFALMDQNVDPAGMLYQPHYYGQPTRYTSYEDKAAGNSMAEGGGEGGSDAVRDDFVDTAAFLTGRTNADGQAELTFKLPDNLTSWRITAAAVSDAAQGGSTTAKVAVSIPYFINLVLNDTYTEGDDIAFSARVYGADQGADVRYTVKFNGEEGKLAGTVGSYTHFNLGKVPAGSYEVTLLAETDDYSDGITRTIRVLESRHALSVFARGALESTIKIDAIRYPVFLLIYDGERQLTMNTLSQLYAMDGARLDQKLASAVAAKRFAQLDGEDRLQLREPTLQEYQNYDGGIRLFPYADPDTRTTAFTLAAAADFVDGAAAASYLDEILSDPASASSDVAAAYMGLAAMREPVLADLRALAAQPDGFDRDDQVLLACALALLGDDAGAEELYAALVAPYVTRTDSWCYLDVGSFEDNYAATADAALLASILGHEDQDGLVRYLLENESGETLPAYALISYVNRRALPAADGSFSCVYGGDRRSWSFAEQPVVLLEFTEEELAAANFTSTGAAAYTAVFTGGMDAVKDTAGRSVRVTATLPETASFGKTANITAYVNFAEDCPGDLYTLELVLPTGVRFVSYPYQFDSGVYLLSREANRLTFIIDRNSHKEGVTALKTSFAIKIETRAVLSGHFVLEEPIVTGLGSALVAVGERQILTIQ